MKVLVTGAGALLGQGILRSLRTSSLRPYLVAVDPNPLSAGLYWADSAYIVPLAAGPDYLDRLQDVLRAEQPDAVLIGTDVELPLLAAHREQIERACRTCLVVSSPEVVAIADDKWLTYLFLRSHGFDCPASCLPGDEGRLLSEVGFPLIVKPRVGARSVGVRTVRTHAELQEALQAVPGAIVQECVATEADEYTAGTLSFDGRCAASIVMRRELRDGNTYRAFVEAYPELNRAVRALAECLQPLGPANFQFRLDGGRVKVFEINARFSGTTPLRALAGFNEVEMTLRRLLRGEPVTQPAVAPLVILRHWSETVVRPEEVCTPGVPLHSTPGSIPNQSGARLAHRDTPRASAVVGREE